jgi:very-short-patch-repair endonuclease
MTRHRGIPVTTPTRTIADLRPVLPARELRRAIRQAEVLGFPLGQDATPDRTRSELEFQFLQLCARYRLPKPDVNVRIGSLTVDFLWENQRLVVETDGYQYHRGHAAFEDDRSRDLELRALGYEVVRLSYKQVFDEPARVAGGLRNRLD